MVKGNALLSYGTMYASELEHYSYIEIECSVLKEKNKRLIVLGFVVQFFFCLGALLVAIVVHAIQGFPQLYALAMLGGAIWCIGSSNFFHPDFHFSEFLRYPDNESSWDGIGNPCLEFNVLSHRMGHF